MYLHILLLKYLILINRLCECICKYTVKVDNAKTITEQYKDMTEVINR